MYTDFELNLATAEAVPDSGVGGLGEDSTAFNSGAGFEFGGISELLRNHADIGGGHPVCLSLTVGTGFTCASIATLDIQLVSFPIKPSLLDNGAGGAADGKRLRIAAVVTDIADGDPLLADTFILNGHDLPLGTPIYFSAIATTTGISTNTVYYVIPISANRFKVAASLANARAGTEVDLLTGDGTVTVEFAPAVTIHAALGGLPIFPTPAGTTPLTAGARFEIPLRPLANLTPKHEIPTSQSPTPLTGLQVPLGAGPGALFVAGNAQRYFALRYVASATITAGTIASADLVLNADNSLTYTGSGFQVKG